MRHILPVVPQFYVTAPQPCPYLPDRLERKLFTSLQGEQAQNLHDALSKQGFRRSQNVLYRPACAKCAACLSARVRVADFKPSRTQKRILSKLRRLSRRLMNPWATESQYDLFRRYLDVRHVDGGMADMDVFEFATMVEETPIRSRIIEYSAPESGSPEALIAASLTDVLDDGLSMVYSFYEPEWDAFSLGTAIILDHIILAQELGLPYVYLGYWVPGSVKMGYKSGFAPLELYQNGGWVTLSRPEEYANASLDRTDPIADQVARINLPEGTVKRAAPSV